MAQATEQQVKDLEKALTEQFFLLVQAASFRLQLARKYGLTSKAFLDYSAGFDKAVRSWVLTEVPYEKVLLQNGSKGLIAAGNVKFDDFFDSAQLPKLQALVKKMDAEGAVQGIGFIPLLIWAVIAIVGFFTASKITDDLTKTTKDKEDLMKLTAQTAKDLNLTPEQTAAMISQTQAQASSGTGIGDILKYGLILAGAFLGLKVVTSFSKTK